MVCLTKPSHECSIRNSDQSLFFRYDYQSFDKKKSDKNKELNSNLRIIFLCTTLACEIVLGPSGVLLAKRHSGRERRRTLFSQASTTPT